MKKKIVLIGNGMTSHKFCEKFANHPNRNQFDLVVYGEETLPAYDRVHLSEYFSSSNAEDLLLASSGWYSDNGITLKTGQLVISIDLDKKEIKTHLNIIEQYDYLILCTGSSAFVPSIPNINLSGVFVYRTIEDLQAIIKFGKENIETGKDRVTIMGGGLLGLEAAKAVFDMGLQTTVIEYAPRLMPRQLDTTGAETLKGLIEQLNIHVSCAKETINIEGETRIESLRFSDGISVQTDMLVISAGIRPRDELAKSCSLLTHKRGGILVNEKMETNAKDVYAIGEVASFQDQTFGLVAPCYEMANVAISQILGDSTQVMSTEVDMSTKLKLIGTDVGSFGNAFADESICKQVVYHDKVKGIYKRLNVSLDGTTLLGGILVGDTEDYNMLHQLYQNNIKLPENLSGLLIRSDGADLGLGSVLDLPDAAIVCSCESVTKENICTVIKDSNCFDVKSIATKTKAGTGCGGCKPMLKDILEASLKEIGKEVKEEICEHFPYSRQELYDIILVKKISNYDSALNILGKGDGCEICKPSLASIFAGVYNETAVKQETIQDTNDRYLANIQRNGTYSVVPRVPGGEITPEKLIVLGQVAKKYDLYSKITGGQRIDLFGARVDQLPLIWKDLIEAGFESGHAYGKALRTVKSCVGSTWCRYGMDESVSFAIELENRYRGIRSPHKLKGGVSGCIRECAEARCKDFGVIATEDGWNLYVCGNGGANPKHAKLLAESIDNETVIKYLDRFLMYYIKTAPPLTRTAKWLDKLEGGISYLKDIVIDDTLQIADELEKEMAGLVHSYSCEWKEVVESPELQKRFTHFINSDEPDHNARFVPMRDQKMPSPWK